MINFSSSTPSPDPNRSVEVRAVYRPLDSAMQSHLFRYLVRLPTVALFTREALDEDQRPKSKSEKKSMDKSKTENTSDTPATLNDQDANQELSTSLSDALDSPPSISSRSAKKKVKFTATSPCISSSEPTRPKFPPPTPAALSTLTLPLILQRYPTLRIKAQDRLIDEAMGVNVLVRGLFYFPVLLLRACMKSDAPRLIDCQLSVLAWGILGASFNSLSLRTPPED